MKVYRIENKNSDTFFHIVWNAEKKIKHPMWNAELMSPFNMKSVKEEKFNFVKFKDFCAFGSVKQFLKHFYFPPLLEALDELDVKFVVYEIDGRKVKKGQDQVLFPKPLAKKIAEHFPSKVETELA